MFDVHVLCRVPVSSLSVEQNVGHFRWGLILSKWQQFFSLAFLQSMPKVWSVAFRSSSL